MTPPVVEFQRVTKSYFRGEQEIPVLKDFSLSVPPGRFLAIMGPSGSGKTTILNLVAGLDRPTQGTIRAAGLAVSQQGESDLARWRARHIGFVFQFYNLVPSLTARENVALVTEIAVAPMEPEEALDWVGLGARMDHFPAEMSGGEQQRVAIARAIAKRPDVLLCDEPTGALDSKTGIRVLEALTRINTDLGTTTAVITHNAAIREIAHTVVSFADGRVSDVHHNETRRTPAEITW